MSTLRERGDHLRDLVGEGGWVSRVDDEWLVSCKSCRTKRKRTTFRSALVREVAALWLAHEASGAHEVNAGRGDR